MRNHKIVLTLAISLFIIFGPNLSQLNGQRLPESRWIDGALLRAENSQNVYLIYNNNKYRVSNPVSFENIGLSWDDVQVRDRSEISSLKIGGYIPHTPPGSLIREKGKQTVYIVWNGNKYGIPDPQTARDLRGDKWNRCVIQWPEGVIDLIPHERDIPSSSGWGEHRFFGGYCTWYIALKRKIPWGGNANEWLTNATNAGFFTGDNPVPGSIMVTTDGRFGHVAIVEIVTHDRDGNWKTFQVSEMNWGSIRAGQEELGKTVNFNKVTRRFFTRKKPPNLQTLLGFIY